MNKPEYTKIIFCCVVLSLCLWLSRAQSQPVQYELGGESVTLNIGRDNPFAKIFDNQKTMLQEASQLSRADANSPKLFLETITLKSLNVESFKPLIEGVCSKYGFISIDKNSNTLIIYDTKEALAKIKELVPPKEIITENLVHRSYRIVYADIEEVENTLRAFISKSGNLSANPSTSNILVVDFESNIKIIDSFINEIDRMTPQILVEARIYDITSKDKLDLGVEWQAGRNTVYGAATSGVGTLGVNPTEDNNPFMTGVFSGATGKTSGAVGALRLGWLNTGVDIDVILRAQQNIVNAKLLANPRISVLDNKTANINIVSKIPYQARDESTEGSGTTSSTEFEEVGVKLEVTPHLARDGMIRLELKPEFSVKVGDVTFESEGLTYPQPVIDKREANTTLLVQSGQTVVLGGLRKKDVTRQANKVPLLGDLPLVGLLFKFEGEDTVISEIVVFVTPWIIEPQRLPGSPDLTNLSETEKQQFEITDFKGPEPVNTKAEGSEE